MNDRTNNAPALSLAARYKTVFWAAWAHRAELAGPKLLSDEAAFLPAALSLQQSPVHPAPRRFAYVLMALFVVIVLWACFGKVDIVAVAAGRIIVSERTKLIQPLERSVVKRVLVKDGDHVAAGQALVELDPTTASADKASVQEQLKAAQSEALRTGTLLARLGQPNTLLNKEQTIEQVRRLDPSLNANNTHTTNAAYPPDWTPTDIRAADNQLNAEWADISAQLAKLGAEAARRRTEISTVQAVMAKLETTVPLSRQREKDFQDLSSQGFMSSHAGQDRTRERIELERDLSTQQARLAEARATLQESEQSKAAYLAETKRSLFDRQAQAKLKLGQATQDHAKASQRERLTTLTAPVAGTVQQLAAHTIGGVVTEAQSLMVIVPDDAKGAPVVAEVALENKDIGFVAPGQDAEVKLETFMFTRYGTVAAKVQLVTADAVTDDKRGTSVFPARLLLQANHINVDGKNIKLTPGMNLTAEIKTGQRRVIEYLLSPIQRAGHESLRER